MRKKQIETSRPPRPRAPVTPGSPSDADRLAQGLPLESGDAQPRPVRRVH